MRRALLRQMPAFTRFYGIKPWELELFTLDELNEYLRQWSEHLEQQQRAALERQRDARFGGGSRRRR